MDYVNTGLENMNVNDWYDEYVIFISIILFFLVTLGYSLLFAGSLLVWVALVPPLILIYFAWRFVRAVERIAASLED